MFKLKDRVEILTARYTDNRKVVGTIIGIKLRQDSSYAGLGSEKFMIDSYNIPIYTVFYMTSQDNYSEGKARIYSEIKEYKEEELKITKHKVSTCPAMFFTNPK